MAIYKSYSYAEGKKLYQKGTFGTIPLREDTVLILIKILKSLLIKLNNQRFDTYANKQEDATLLLTFLIIYESSESSLLILDCCSSITVIDFG